MNSKTNKIIYINEQAKNESKNVSILIQRFKWIYISDKNINIIINKWI